MTFEPKEADIEWARFVLNVMSHGGILHFPNTGLTYIVDHNMKKLVLQNPLILVDPIAFEIHKRTEIVFCCVEYRVETLIQGDN